MKKSDFNALLAHIENELQGFKRHYKLYGEVYMLRNNDKTKFLSHLCDGELVVLSLSCQD